MNIDRTQDYFLQVIRELGFTEVDIEANRTHNGRLIAEHDDGLFEILLAGIVPFLTRAFPEGVAKASTAEVSS
jgi:hypothetical protein